MIVKYECQYCGATYDTANKCAKCEESHLEGKEQILYNLRRKGENPCDWCQYSYYAYGCERDCEQRCQGHNKFIPSVPFHDKRKNGGF